MNGNELSEKLLERLDDLKVLPYDHNLYKLLTSLTKAELSQLVNLGDVTEWHNDRIDEKYKYLENEPVAHCLGDR